MRWRVLMIWIAFNWNTLYSENRLAEVLQNSYPGMECFETISFLVHFVLCVGCVYSM